jgi:hypothetical protein
VVVDDDDVDVVYSRAQEYFETHILPRRIRDYSAEQNYERANGGLKKIIYRKVAPNEIGIGEPFPVWNAGLSTFSTFGKGIGIYFIQLIILSGVTLLTGMVMMVAVRSYRRTGYGIQAKGGHDQYLLLSAACNPFSTVNASQGCAAGQSTCAVNFRDGCSISIEAVLADLSMSVIFAAVILLSKLLENRFKKELDEAIQTLQDYSLMVNDPPLDADDPDEWYQYFSRFGTVRYISVIRDNHILIDRIEALHDIEIVLKTLRESSTAQQQTLHWERQRSRARQKWTECKQALEQALRQNYSVAKVIVTFEFEEHQRLCQRDLEVADYKAVLDLKDQSQGRKLFRDEVVLDIQEPPEPDNFCWENLSPLSIGNRIFRLTIAWCLTIGTLVVSWYLILISSGVSSYLLAMIIGTIDTWLPIAFKLITSLDQPQSFSQFENLMQKRLFLARLLFSTVLPYAQSSWSSVLDVDFIQKVTVIQASICFTAPILAYFDVFGFIYRSIVAPRLLRTQQQLNKQWSGSDWSLAEKYTNLSKVLFVSLFYALLTPFSILLSFFAFVLTFAVDRYLLLRKWKPMCMLDEEVANRLRQQAMLAVLVHMYVTSRFIYSWPMDDSYFDNVLQIFVKVDKFPSYSPFHWQSNLNWQSTTQQKALKIYQIGFFAVTAVVIILWVILPLYEVIHKWFFYTLEVTGDSQCIGFSSIDNIHVYEPVFSRGRNKYLCSYVKEMLPQHRPPLFVPQDEASHDLTIYVRPDLQKYVLSVIKHYGDELNPSAAAVVAVLRDDDIENIGRISINDIKFGKGEAVRGYSIHTTDNGVLVRIPPNTNPSLPTELLAKISPTEVDIRQPRSTLSQFEMGSQESSTTATEPKRIKKKMSSAQHSRRLDKFSTDGVTMESQVLSDKLRPKRQFTPKPLYQQLYGLSSSSDEDNNSDQYNPKTDNFVRHSLQSASVEMTNNSRPKSIRDSRLELNAKFDDRLAPIERQSKDSDSKFIKPKRSESPPRTNFRV